jgi:hypothetical protein
MKFLRLSYKDFAKIKNIIANVRRIYELKEIAPLVENYAGKYDESEEIIRKRYYDHIVMNVCRKMKTQE